jgi:hypothetical protein
MRLGDGGKSFHGRENYEGLPGFGNIEDLSLLIQALHPGEKPSGIPRLNGLTRQEASDRRGSNSGRGTSRSFKNCRRSIEHAGYAGCDETGEGSRHYCLYAER